MFDSNSWRDRSNVFKNFENFAKMLGDKVFTREFIDFIKEGLSDRIYEIRKESIGIIVTCTEIFGSNWFQTNILGYLFAFKSDRNYLHRQTPLFAFQRLAKTIVKIEALGMVFLINL